MINEYTFQSLGEESNYRQFPDEIENNNHILFHGTAEVNFENIKKQGFQPKTGGELNSISFAKNSSLALDYACAARNALSPKGIIIMIDISNIKQECIVEQNFGIHLSPKFQPKIIGYCLVPENYKFK